MSAGRRRYNTNYKKKVDIERDAYLPRRSPGGLVSCRGCGAVYVRRRWAIKPRSEIWERVEAREGVVLAYCPAYRKIRDRHADGVLEISGITSAERLECIRLLKNEEVRTREKTHCRGSCA